MRSLFALALLAATAPVATSARVQPPLSAIGYTSVAVAGARFHAVIANMGTRKLAAKTVHSPRLVSVRQMVASEHAVAAITGTFYSPRSQRPVAQVLVDGKLVSTGNRGSAVGVDWMGKVRVFDTRHAKGVDWSSYRYGFRGAVRVVTDGKVHPNPKAQKFKDRKIWGRAARTGLGITKSGKLCMIATSKPVTLSELGVAMKKLGVVDGVSMDGGGSTCLYYGGAYVVAPKRKLSNLFVVSPSGL